MVFVFNGVEVEFGHYSERTSIATKHTPEKFDSQFIIVILRHESGFWSNYMHTPPICQNDIESLNIVDAETERVKKVAKTSCLSMASNIDERTFSVRNRYFILLHMS